MMSGEVLRAGVHDAPGTSMLFTAQRGFIQGHHREPRWHSSVVVVGSGASQPESAGFRVFLCGACMFSLCLSEVFSTVLRFPLKSSKNIILA